MALSIRYEQAPGQPELQTELPWLADVYQEAMRLVGSMAPIPRHHAQGLLKHYVLKYISSPSDAAPSSAVPAPACDPS